MKPNAKAQAKLRKSLASVFGSTGMLLSTGRLLARSVDAFADLECNARCCCSSVAATQVKHCGMVESRTSPAGLRSCQKASYSVLSHCTN